MLLAKFKTLSRRNLQNHKKISMLGEWMDRQRKMWILKHCHGNLSLPLALAVIHRPRPRLHHRFCKRYNLARSCLMARLTEHRSTFTCPGSTIPILSRIYTSSSRSWMTGSSKESAFLCIVSVVSVVLPVWLSPMACTKSLNAACKKHTTRLRSEASGLGLT